MSTGLLWQVARIPLLVGLLLTPTQFMLEWARTSRELDAAASAGPWIAMMIIGLVFLAVAFAGRRRDPSRIVLGVEVLLVAAVVLPPPTYWIAWLGLDVLGTFSILLGTSSGNMFVPAMLLAWLVIASRRLAQLLRTHEKETLQKAPTEPR